MDKKWILLIFLCYFTTTVFAARQVIRFATEASYPPFEFIDSQNKMIGFDIDLAKAICQKIAATCTFSNISFPTLIPSLKFHRYDAVISSLQVTPARKKQISFSHIYFNKMGSRLLIRQNSFTSLTDLNGKKVGVQNGTTHQQYLLHHFPHVTTVPYESYQQAILDLKNGRLAAVLADNSAVTDWLSKNPQLVTLGPLLVDSHYHGEGIAIAVNKHNKALLDKLNQGLDAIKQDGSYQKIYHHWFPQ